MIILQYSLVQVALTLGYLFQHKVVYKLLVQVIFILDIDSILNCI